jgi:hypothetical protein
LLAGQVCSDNIAATEPGVLGQEDSYLLGWLHLEENFALYADYGTYFVLDQGFRNDSLGGEIIVHYLLRLFAQLLEIPLGAAAFREQLIGGVKPPSFVFHRYARAEYPPRRSAALLTVGFLLGIHGLHQIK